MPQFLMLCSLIKVLLQELLLGDMYIHNHIDFTAKNKKIYEFFQKCGLQRTPVHIRATLALLT